MCNFFMGQIELANDIPRGQVAIATGYPSRQA